MYVLAELAERQGLLKGDLNAFQRTALAYLVGRQKQADRQRRIEDFKNMIVAFNPEMIEVFNEVEAEDLAQPLSDEEMEQLTPLSVEEMEQLDSIVRALGGAIG